MIATWMLYCVLCAAGVALAALVAERALAAGRSPLRYVWVGAVMLSVWVPVLAYRYAPRQAAPPTGVVLDRAVVAPSVVDSTVAATLPASPAPTVARTNWRAMVTRADDTLVGLWIVLSIGVALYFFGGVVGLALMRRVWRRETVLGVPVLVSNEMGPALVGAVSPAIVVPEWALAMDPAQIALMLRHEQEHRRAGDGRLLAAAHLALVVMPWNVALWWQLLRLRVAVELDCDARVLRYADARSYGDLLLEVARPRRRPRLIAVTAFAERASQLERRIRFVARQRDRAARGTRVGAALVALATVTAAWVSPKPSVPARAVTPTAPRGAPQRDTMPATPVESHIPQRRYAFNDEHSDARIVPRPAPKPIVRKIDSAAPATQAPPTSPPFQQPDSLFQILFNGIALTPEQAALARGLVAKLEKADYDRSMMELKLLVSDVQGRIQLVQHRDSTLLAIVSDDSSRALLRSRLIPPNAAFGGGVGGGRRGGGGSGVPGGVGGGASGGVGGAGARGGSAAPALRLVPGGGRGGGAAPPVDEMSEIIYQRLFDGITFSPAQSDAALIAIRDAEQQSRDRAQRLPPQARIRLRSTPGGVVVDSASAAQLIGLLSSDADRATLASRLVILKPRP